MSDDVSEAGAAAGAGRPRRLHLTGELTIVTAADLHARILSFVEEPAPAYEIDLSGVVDVDTAGLQLLLMARGEADRRGAALRLRAPGEAVTDVLAVANLDHELRPVRTEEA